MKAHLNWNCVV